MNLQILHIWAVLVLLGLYILLRTLYRIWWHPLREFPGPWLASVSHLYEFYYDVVLGGMYMQEIGKMHKQYGPVVRINPHELHINDPRFYDQVYASSGRRRNKYVHSVPMFGVPSAMVATVDHDHHRFRRGLVSNLFSKKAMFDVEPILREKQLKLMQRFEEAHEKNAVVNIDAAFSALTADIVSLHLYGACFNYLDDENFNNDIREAINEISEAVHISRFFPALKQIVETLPRWALVKFRPAALKLFQMQEAITRHSDRAIQDPSNVKSFSRKDNKTMFAALSDPQIPPHERTLQRLEDEGLINLIAGTETSARAMSIAILHISQNERVRIKLREELRKELPTPDSPASWSRLENLPYMNAVVKESLRLSYGPVVRSPRIAPDEVLVYGHYRIPPGTPVSMSSYHIHRDPDTFPLPERFIPERWIQGPENAEPLGKFMVAFSKGSRNCLGMNLALLEIYTTIAYAVRRFDFQISQMNEETMVFFRDYGIGQPKEGHFHVQAKVSAIIQD